MPGQSTDETKLPPRRRGPRVGVDGPTNLGLSPHQGHKPGDIIGTHYKVVRLIGSGGMGVVYEVINTIIGVSSAVKRLSPELASSRKYCEEFVREASDSMQFSTMSRYLVTTQTVAIDDYGPFLVLDYIEHPTLRTVINQHSNGIDLHIAVNILHGLAVAISELHRVGYVHKDLKPENVFVGSHVYQTLVMLADFGLSKPLNLPTSPNIHKAGTERYMSPEQRNGLETDVRTDIYSFGIMAIELLTGDVLSPGDSLEDEKPDLPSSLCALVMRCTKRRKEQRPATSDELFDDLDAIRNALRVPTFPSAVLHFVTKQDGVMIDWDGNQISAESPLVIPFETSDERRIRVDAKWRHVSLLISFINLSPGDEHTIELPAGFVFDADLPTGCTLFYKNGSAVSLPISGQMPQQGYYYFEVFHDGASVLTQKVTIHPGENFWRPSIVLPAKPEMRRTTLQFTNLQPDANVRVEGTTIIHKYGWSAMVAAERIRRVHVEVDWRGLSVYSVTVPLNAGEHKVIDLPHVYELNANLPKEVTVKDESGVVQTFPMRGKVPSSGYLLLMVSYRGMSLGKFEVSINSVDVAWAPVLPIPQPSLLIASKLELVDVQLGATVWIDGVQLKAPYIAMFDIAIGSSKVVSVKCKWHNLTLYSTRVRVTAGKTRKVSIPKGFELHATNIPPNSSIETMDGLTVTFPYLGIVPESRKISFTLRLIGKSPIVQKVPVHIGACLWNVAK